jgi:dihydrofolate synthase / folylpolyglutamate synthase
MTRAITLLKSQPVHPKNRLMPDQFDPDPRLQEILDRITTYYPRAIDPNLTRTFRLLNDLGNPHLSMPPSIHVAGTNGKGSTVAFLRAVLEAAGKKCHIMTSPHLVHFNERIVLAGQQIPTPDLIEIIEEVERVNNGLETTSFEIITAAGFLAFSRIPADFCVVEVGMGGRFDATNVIPSPLASVITVISRDHIKFLGGALDAIAYQKAGIIKPNAPCIVGPQIRAGMVAGVMDVFEDIAADVNAPLYRHGLEWAYDILPDRFILHTQNNIYEFPKPNLLGDHQYGNAATAAMTLMAIQEDYALPLSAFEYGLTHAKWEGRLQRLSSGPLVDSLPPYIECWIDGGHNDSGGMVLGIQADTWKASDSKPLHLIMGMLNTKDPVEFANFILPKCKSAQAITIPDQPLSLTANELGAALNINAASSYQEAVQNICRDEKSPARILITGSLYLMGSILKDNQ